MDLAGGQGCGVGSDHGPRADPLPAEAAFVRRAYGGPVAGSGELGGEGGRCSAVRIIQPQLHERAIRHPQSGWTASSRNRPQGTEHVSSTSSLQDGGHPSAAGPSATGRFHDEGGLKGRLPDSPHGEVSPTPSGIPVAGSALPLQSPPLWPCAGTTDFHEAAAPGGGGPAANGSPVDHLSGRHPDPGPVGSRVSPSDRDLAAAAILLGLCGQPGEVGADPDARTGVSRLPDHLSSNGLAADREEAAEDSVYMPDPSCGRDTIPSRAGQLHRQPNGSVAGCAPSPLAHASSASHSRSGGAAGASLDFTSRLDTRGGRRSAMVDSPSGPVERPAPSSGSSHDADSLGRSHRRRWRRLGSSVRFASNRRPLVAGGADLAYQRVGAAGCQVSRPVFCQDRGARPHRPPARQSGGGELHKSNGRNPQPAPRQDRQGAVGMVLGQGDYGGGRIPSRLPKHRRRFPVQTPRLGRVAASSGRFPAAATPLPSQLNRPVRDQNQCPAVSLRVLAARATVRRYRRLHSRLAARKGLRLSPLRSSRQGDSPGATPGGAITGAGDTDVEGSSLVSSSAGSDRGPAVSSSGASGPSPRPSGSSSPAGPSGTAAPLRVAHLRSVHAAAGLPESVSELLVASWRPGTSRRYNSVWAVWRSWCRGRAVDPVSPLLRDVLTFLAETFAQDRSYRTIAGYRSALSSALPPIDGVAVGAHPTVCRLLKGAYNTRPPRPRYATTWDVGGVLSHLRSWGPSAQLSDRRLTLRLAMLLALAGARRSGELASMGRPLLFTAEGVTIPLLSPTKTQRCGEPLRQLRYAEFDNELLCPVAHLRVYEARSATWHPEPPPHLLLSFRRPHKSVASSTVARWLRTVLSEAGVDVAVFRAHSTRGAASSAAAGAGVSMTAILATADWRQASTFRRFYHRREAPSSQTVFQEAVLSRSPVSTADSSAH